MFHCICLFSSNGAGVDRVAFRSGPTSRLGLPFEISGNGAGLDGAGDAVVHVAVDCVGGTAVYPLEISSDILCCKSYKFSLLVITII